ncbi:MAG TPA: glycosyltransferase family 4 protein [Gemmatimonadaceae bacterium]|nr:glycosyltransferase family 4 protein [Gemmatimonadaceae bacterium]
MRILVVNWQDLENPSAGGAELHLHEVFGRIARMGKETGGNSTHEVDVLCSGFAGGPAHVNCDALQIYRVGSRFTFPLHARRAYTKLAAQRSYDIVVENLNKIPLYTKRWRPRRLVALTHHLFGATVFREASFPLAAATWLAEQPLARGYRGVPFEAVSESTADDLVSRGIARDRIQVIFNGVDVQTLTPDQNSRSETPVFVYLGRLKRYKRVDIVIKAFALLDRKDARLEIAGKGDDRDRLERLVSDLHIEHRVRFLGYITEPEKRDLLRRAWASILASPKEGWGISNLETAACGTPVIAADAPGIRESVIDGDTGFLVPGSDVGAYAAAMRRLLESPSVVRTLGENARRFAETFTWDRAAHETITHLRHIVEGDTAWKS